MDSANMLERPALMGRYVNAAALPDVLPIQDIRTTQGRSDVHVYVSAAHLPQIELALFAVSRRSASQPVFLNPSPIFPRRMIMASPDVVAHLDEVAREHQ